MHPRWFQLASGFGRYLTIPFMIGALRKPVGAKESPDMDHEGLVGLLGAMDEGMPAGHFAHIHWCQTTVKEYVVAIHPDYGTVSGKKLVWDLVNGDSAPDREALASLFWGHYRQHLANQEFSCDDSVFHEFSPKDRADINAFWSKGV